MAYTKRDNMTPMPTADNVQRKNEAGNVSVTGEKHDQSKSEKIGSDSNRTTGPVAMAVQQPTRMNGDGNTEVSGESHGQKKAEKVLESQRW